MLVLHRKPAAGDKSILCIGHDVTVTVLSIRGELVELAVSAPAGVAVEAKSSIPSRRKNRTASHAGKTQSGNLLSSTP